MNRDRFGFNTVEDPAIEKIAEDFGESFGSDLSMWVTEHYKNTGQQIKVKDIDDSILQFLKSNYAPY